METDDATCADPGVAMFWGSTRWTSLGRDVTNTIATFDISTASLKNELQSK